MAPPPLSLAPAPAALQEAAAALLSGSATAFLARLLHVWEPEAEALLLERRARKVDYDKHCRLPCFPTDSPARQDTTWKVAALPRRLGRRHLDLGDVSPADTDRFLACLNQDVDGIQTDFDDGHCPTWHNQLQGWWNVYRHTHGLLGGPGVEAAPVMMLRPRAWNMTEHNILLGGRPTSGPLVDFGLLMFHCGAALAAAGSGPFFYLSKLEGSQEAALWNRIFLWTQEELCLPRGTIKACVLIENIFAAFEMEEILWELREHSAGLNCGMWDYSASFINKFGDRPEFQLPDRSKYVSMTNPFLSNYLRLVVQTCTRRGAPATGGMAARILPSAPDAAKQEVDKVVSAKRKEVEWGVQGFLLYDFGLVAPCRALWASTAPGRPDPGLVTAEHLLALPPGGITRAGLRHNVLVGVLFIAAWLEGRGVVEVRGSVEDSATAEISRSQVWQWIRHRAVLEEDGAVVTAGLVRGLVAEVVVGEPAEEEAGQLFMEVVTARLFPEFLTTLLSDGHTFRRLHTAPGPWGATGPD